MGLIEQIQAANVLEAQREALLSIVRGIRPLAIVDRNQALMKLLEIFMEDTDRAPTLAAFAVLELALVNLDKGGTEWVGA